MAALQVIRAPDAQKSSETVSTTSFIFFFQSMLLLVFIGIVSFFRGTKENSSKSCETALQNTQVMILTAARGHGTTTPGLFKERSLAVLINPYFTFHIPSRLSGPQDRSQFIILPLYSHTSAVTYIHTLLGYLCASVSFQSLPFLSISSLSSSLPLFLLPLTFLRGVNLQGGCVFFFSSSPSSSI